jgi:hypothetical protein
LAAQSGFQLFEGKLNTSEVQAALESIDATCFRLGRYLKATTPIRGGQRLAL